MPHRPKHLKLNTEGKKCHWLHTIPQDLESWEVKGKLKKQGLLGAPHLHGIKDCWVPHICTEENWAFYLMGTIVLGYIIFYYWCILTQIITSVFCILIDPEWLLLSGCVSSKLKPNCLRASCLAIWTVGCTGSLLFASWFLKFMLSTVFQQEEHCLRRVHMLTLAYLFLTCHC